jgi:pilus assembly protein CpaC
VVNLLNVNVPPSDPQILLKVRFASVDRSLEKQLGINLFDLGLGNALGGVTTGQFSPPTLSGTGSSSTTTGGGVTGSGGTAGFTNELNLLAFFPGLKSGADIEALETKGVVEVLAEPNLLAANGKEASFLAGGEYPYPVAQGSGGTVTVTIQFKEYGIRLNFIPTITPRGTIRLQVAPEVSQLDFTNAVTLSGFEVPAITSRKVNTEVELQDRQTFVIGGLLNNQETETLQKIPFIGDIPILGKLFQSMTRTKSNSELIVSVTPEIVAPIPAGQPIPGLHYPVKFLPPNSNTPMHTPDAQTAGTTPPPPQSIPVEQLLDSLKPEKPLVVEGSGTFGGAGASLNGAGTVGASTQSQ